LIPSSNGDFEGVGELELADVVLDGVAKKHKRKIFSREFFV
jgi:hypothetical protein